MKTFSLCGVIGSLVFLVAGYQMGIFHDQPVSSEKNSTTTVDDKPAQPVANFPADLARAVRRQPVSEAATFNADAKTHRLVFLKSSGALHPWQDELDEEWAAETVEHTELVVVILRNTKKMIEHIPFPNGAPPIERFRWDLDAYVVEAKTGDVLASRHFVNMPRTLKSTEAWELTALGSPVSFRTVFHWVTSMTRNGFPRQEATTPLITVVD